MEQSYFQQYVVNGGVMMFFLIPCSLLAIGFMIQGFINLRRGRIVPKAFPGQVGAKRSVEELPRIADAIEGGGSTLARALKRIIPRLKARHNPDNEEDIISDVIDDEIDRLYHNNNQLVIIYTVSPLLGLLGTILGMMKTFYQFSASTEQSIALLSKGINEALVTTMWGLSIAIPSFIILSLFRHRLFRYQSDVLPTAVHQVVRGIGDRALWLDEDGSKEKEQKGDT